MNAVASSLALARFFAPLPKRERGAHAARVPVWAARPNFQHPFFGHTRREEVGEPRFSAGRRKQHAGRVRSPELPGCIVASTAKFGFIPHTS
jgi:hypothetical protein